MSDLLTRLATSVAQSNGLESLTRPMLELLQVLTGLESTYLTRIDSARSLQAIEIALNTGEMRIPEGIEVPWDDTLCRRAIESGTCATTDVPALWPESDAARALGITTYVTTPVRDGEGRLMGTLCGASRERRELPPQTQEVLALFARLIAQQMEREALLSRLQAANAALSDVAATDALTDLPNRRALRGLLDARFREARAEGRQLVVGFVDLDGFKAINDAYGHAIGDRFLHAIALRLAEAMRPGDVVGRWGGDEFLVLFEGPGRGDAPERLQLRLETASRGHFVLGEIALDYPGASVGVAATASEDTGIDAVIARADAAMYARKQARRSKA